MRAAVGKIMLHKVPWALGEVSLYQPRGEPVSRAERLCAKQIGHGDETKAVHGAVRVSGDAKAIANRRNFPKADDMRAVRERGARGRARLARPFLESDS